MDWAKLRKYLLPVALIVIVALPIMLLCFLDYYNLEGYNYSYNAETNSFDNWSNTFFNQNFTFDVTWKGRMFYVIFLWLFLIEAAFGWKLLVDKKARKRLIAAAFALALIPTAYVLATNFFGLDLQVLRMGQAVGVPSITSDNQPWDFLHLFWPLSVEYIVFAVFFIASVFFLYRFKGLKTFSISLTLLAGMAVAYLLDTVFPFGVLRPLQEFALPVTATAAAIFDYFGYMVLLTYPQSFEGSLMPNLLVGIGEGRMSANVSWACAGVYSFLLYILIIIVFFKKTQISPFRKLLYFFIGLCGTFFVAVFRLMAIYLVSLQYGNDAGMIFHNTYGELFGFGWILGFILIIVCVEKYMLVERTRQYMRKIAFFLGTAKNSGANNL